MTIGVDKAIVSRDVTTVCQRTDGMPQSGYTDLLGRE
jgi:hypothetical protein